MHTPDDLKDLNISLIQADLAWEDPQANYRKFENFLRDIPAGTQLVLLPEMFPTGFSMHPQGKGEPEDGPTLEWMTKMASETGAVLAGSVIIEEEGRHYNRMLVVGAGGLLGTYNKRHLFRMAGEDEEYSTTGGRETITINGWRVRLQICYDLRFPAFSRNEMGGKDAYDLLVYVANWPTPRISHWNALLPARAIENQAYAAGVNRIGEDGNNLSFPGSSVILDPLGEPLAKAGAGEEIISATLKIDPLRAYREKFPAWRDADQINFVQ